MGFMNTIKSLFGGSNGSARRDARTYVVDAARLVDEKTGRRLAPREQVQLLNALARVAKQENLVFHAVFESERPLREVEHGGEFNGVKVYFAADSEKLVEQALKLCKSEGCALISSGATLESRATEEGIAVLCSSTFRKAFLPSGLPSNERNGRGDRGSRERRRDRGPRRERNDQRPPRPEAAPGAPAGDSATPDTGANPDPAPPQEDNSAVRNLIDLVE